MKGSVLDLLFLVFIAFVFAISTILGYFILGNVESRWDLTESMNETKTIITKGKSAIDMLDAAFLVVLISFGLAAALGAFLIRLS